MSVEFEQKMAAEWRDFATRCCPPQTKLTDMEMSFYGGIMVGMKLMLELSHKTTSKASGECMAAIDTWRADWELRARAAKQNRN